MHPRANVPNLERRNVIRREWYNELLPSIRLLVQDDSVVLTKRFET